MRLTTSLHSLNNKTTVFFVICFTCYISILKNYLIITSTYVLRQIPKLLLEENIGPCKILHLNPFAELHFYNVTKIKCPKQDWVKCYFSKCEIIPEILHNSKSVKCTFNDILYVKNMRFHLGPGYIVRNRNKYILTYSDHVKVTCVAKELNNRYSNRQLQWKGYASGIRSVIKHATVPPGREDTYNVLILGYESLTRNDFIRGMPKSYSYLIDIMNGTILNGYNILDYSRTPALFPLLTGKTESELPDVTKGSVNSFDSLPFLFYQLKQDGYRTAYLQDVSWATGVQRRFNGFREQPTDHYLNAFHLAATNTEWFKKHENGYCLGDTPQFKFMMNFTDQFLHLDGKKFIVTLISDVTRGSLNAISITDDDLVGLFQSLVRTGVLQNTLIIIMGDHGKKHDHFRNTFQSILEERLPFMCVVLPGDLQSNHPRALSAIEANANVLTTPYDIHATILDALDLRQHMNRYKIPGTNMPRALSLLKRIPIKRTCIDAGINPIWCACHPWKDLTSTDDMFNKASTALVDYINYFTASQRYHCNYRTVKEVRWVKQQRGLAQFSEAVNYFDTSENYHVKIILNPDQAVIEAFLKYIVEEDRFMFDNTDITRTDAYDADVKCKERMEILPSLRPYCHCVDDISLFNLV